MTESAWKVVMDGDGLTISGETFSLTTSGSDPGSLDTVVTELQAMSRGTYGQYCGLSRALEAVGERWGLLVVRDLLINPKSTSELRRGLRTVPQNLLSMRLKEMAFIGVVEKDGTTDADGEERYRLTDYGRELEPVLLALGRWGAGMLATPRPEDVVTQDAMMIGLRATFVPEAAAGRDEQFEMHLPGGIVIHLIVQDGELEVGRGPLPGAPVIEPGLTLKHLLTRQMSVDQAKATGEVKITGDQEALDKLVSMFSLPNRQVEPSVG